MHKVHGHGLSIRRLTHTHTATGAVIGSLLHNALRIVEDAGVTREAIGALTTHVRRAVLYLWPWQREELLVVSVQTVQAQNLCMVFLECMAAGVLTPIITGGIGLLLFLVFLIVNVACLILPTLVTDVTVVLVRDIMHFLVKVEQEPMRWAARLTVKVTTVELDGSEYDITTALKK